MKNGLIVFSPRSHLIYCILIGFLFMLVPTNCFSQSGTITGSGSVTYNSDGSVKISGSKTFTSHVVGTNESVDNMLQLDVIHLYSTRLFIKLEFIVPVPNGAVTCSGFPTKLVVLVVCDFTRYNKDPFFVEDVLLYE